MLQKFTPFLFITPGTCLAQPLIIESFSTNIVVSGSAVAVECVFSGGRDTISLWRASLWPETIKVLMLVKKKLHLARAQATAALQR